jgi:hypothetical protein
MVILLYGMKNSSDLRGGIAEGCYAGILSDSGVHDLFGAEAVQLARSMAPGLSLCVFVSDAKRADLEAAKPDGVFSKDRAKDAGLAIGLIRKLSGGARP